MTTTVKAEREVFDRVHVFIGQKWVGYKVNRPSHTSIVVSNGDERVSVTQSDDQDFHFTYLTKQGIASTVTFSGNITADLMHSIIDGLFGTGA